MPPSTHGALQPQLLLQGTKRAPHWLGSIPQPRCRLQVSSNSPVQLLPLLYTQLLPRLPAALPCSSSQGSCTPSSSPNSSPRLRLSPLPPLLPEPPTSSVRLCLPLGPAATPAPLPASSYPQPSQGPLATAPPPSTSQSSALSSCSASTLRNRGSLLPQPLLQHFVRALLPPLLPPQPSPRLLPRT